MGLSLLPGQVKGEGLFAACLKKTGDSGELGGFKNKEQQKLVGKEMDLIKGYINNPPGFYYFKANDDWMAIYRDHIESLNILQRNLYIKKSVEMDKQVFTPTPDGNDDKTLHLAAKAPASPDNGSDAKVTLKDGRTMTVNVNAEAARPGLKLLSIHATAAQKDGSLPVTLGAKDDIPLNGQLSFTVQTKDVFPRTQSIEVATANEAVKTKLSIADNTLVLQDDHTAVAKLDPLKAFGQSAFGKLQMRPVAADGTTGAWTSLGTLVRTPQITSIKCYSAEEKTCKAQGSDFFLVQSFGADKDMGGAAEVPTGFADASMDVPMPKDGGTIYVKLRDDPNSVATVKLPQPVQPATASAPAPPTVDAPSKQADAAPASTSEPKPTPPAPASPADATNKPATPQN